MLARLVVLLSLAGAFSFSFSIRGQTALLHEHDCYQRVALGQRLADAALDRSVPLQLLQECERQCSLDLHECNAFAFGVSSKGNGTCALSRQLPARGAAVVEDPDYDLFVKTPECRVPTPTPSAPATPTTVSSYDRETHSSCWRLEAPRRRPSPEQVRRSLPLQSPSACHDACTKETRFACRAFAFRFDVRGFGRGSCELVERPVSALELRPDEDFDLYSLRSCDNDAQADALPGCYLRVQAGHRLEKGAGSVSYSVPSLYDCELICSKESHFVCLTFSFRYSLELRFPHDNCVLSGRDFRDLDPYRDLIPDRDYDTYSWNENPNNCLEAQATSQLPQTDSDCFWRVRSGQRLDRFIIRESFDARSIGDCQRECLASQLFTCRIFSFRYGSPVTGGPVDNCQMSDWPFHELDKHHHLIDDIGYEVYERGSYGYGCEKPALFDEFSECYVTYDRPAQLLPPAVKKSLHVHSEDDCKAACTHARVTFEFSCSSLSYRSSAAPGGAESPNCLLSDSEQRGLLLGADYIHKEGHWLFAWNSEDQHCLVGTNIPRDPPYRDQYPSKWDRPNMWQYFTVSGRPCRRGTQCSLHRDAGFWSCELEGGDVDSWDYCCRPDHHCGYSEDYQYPWCYVGNSNPEQWRPCNDHYFPTQPSHDDGHGFKYEEPQYWPVAYLHKESPPNVTFDSTIPQTDNFLDGYRSNYAKKMNYFRTNEQKKSSQKRPSENIALDVTHTDNPNDISIVIRGTTSIASSKMIPSIKDTTQTVQVVDDDIDLTGVTFEMTDSTNSSKPVEQLSEIYTTTKLHPRFVETETHSTVTKSPGRVSKTWHWKAKDATANVQSN